MPGTTNHNNHHFYLAVKYCGDTWTFDKDSGKWVKNFGGTKCKTEVEAEGLWADAPSKGSNTPYVATPKDQMVALCSRKTE